MKKIVMGICAVVLLTSCSSLDKGSSLEQKYSITKESAKDWDKTIIQVVEGEALLEDWYGAENPIIYLRKNNINIKWVLIISLSLCLEISP